MSLTVELGSSAKESTTQVVGSVAIKVDTVGNAVVNNGCVQRECLDVEKSVGERLLVLEQSVRPLQLEVGDDFRSSLSAEVEVGHDTKGFSRAAKSPEELLVLSGGRVKQLAIGSDNIETNDVVESDTPVTGSVAVPSVGKMATDTNTGAGTVRDGTFALVPDTLSEVTKTNTTANLGDVGGLVEVNVLERLQVNYCIPLVDATCIYTSDLLIEPFLPPLLKLA
jgi:hypothetical protein